MKPSSHQGSYLQYIRQAYPSIDTNTLSQIHTILENTSWESPDSSSDWSNLAVVALSEAEQYDNDPSTRSLYLEIAFDALNQGYELEQHPICAAHLALIHSMIGETQQAMEIAYNALLNSLERGYSNFKEDYKYLIYFPNYQSQEQKYQLETCFQVENSYQQALIVLSQVLYNSQLVFYNAYGRRFLNLAAQVQPHCLHIALKQGISSLMAGELEGLLYLHKAEQIAPNSSAVIQSLYLTYRILNQIETAKYWQKVGQKLYQHYQSPQWYWTQLPIDSTFTYVQFENIPIAVEPSFKSIVTGVLVAENDWFEKEMEFWRNFIKPGMTVIDVGANVGVYTFSAAVRVGSQGRVLAIEPFSGCVQCLQETCKINQFDWVTVYAGAASNCNGTLKLLLHGASELNEVVSCNADDNIPSDPFEEIPCITLDTLIERENIERVDIIKIDAENHELAVLAGSKRILSEFTPVILYENIAGNKGSNYQVAEYLTKVGYELFRYQPYLQSLIPVNLLEEIEGNLNLIAMPLQAN
jgi:FkbM family methyltransferase